MDTTRFPPQIRSLDAEEARHRSGELAAILQDAVAGGASVNFMAGFTAVEAGAFWAAQLPGLRSGERLLLVAEDGDRLVGCVMLSLAQQPNAPHRAEIGKMLVDSAHRRRGIGRALLDAAEAAARSHGRTLLMLDTEQNSGGDLLYRSCGWQALGTVPDRAFRPDGLLAPTTLFFKVLGPHRAPG